MKSHRKQSSKIFFLSLLCAELCILCINCDLKAEEPSSRATGGGQSVQKAASDKPIESTRIYAAGETGVEIFKALARNNSKDVCVAPASIASGLITLSLCTAGQTRNEIFQALGVKDQRELLLLHRDLMSSVSAKQPESRISNAVLVSSAVKLQQGFSAVLQSVLETKLIVAKNSDSGRTLLNQWIMGATAGKIGSRDVESQLSGGVTLFSTIYFKGAWEEKFLSGNTRDEAFTLLTGSTKKVPMMSDGGESYYLSTPEAQVLRRSYRSSSRYAMYFFLPKSVAAFKPFLASLSLRKLRTLMNGCQKRSGGVTLPRFRTVCKSDLTEPLKAAGIKSIFSASADFSPMFSSAQKSVSGSPNHTAMIDVNEEGTEAAAITTFPVEMGVDPAAFSFRADHPFVYAVVDGNNDNILLLGTVVDPEDSRVPQAVEEAAFKKSVLEAEQAEKTSFRSVSVIARLRDLARFYEKSGRYVDALGIMQRITTLVGATSGMGWYEYADALEDQVQLLTKLKKFDSAVNLYPTIIELRHRTEGNYPGHYTASMETYADLLRMAGNPGLSTQVSKQIESYLLDQLRQSNKYVAGPQTELARYYARQGDLKRACVYYDLVVSDPSCAPRTLGEYAKLLKQLHREKEAAVYLKRMPEQWKRRSE